jgi:hypothetical protein
MIDEEALSHFEKLNYNEIILYCVLLTSAWDFATQRRRECRVASQNFQTDTLPMRRKKVL